VIPSQPEGLAVHQHLRWLAVLDEEPRAPGVRLLPGDADERDAGLDRCDRHRDEGSSGVDGSPSPEDGLARFPDCVVVGRRLHLDRDIARNGVDVGGEEDGVVRGRADVSDLVDPRLAAVGLEEVDEPLCGLLLLTRGRGDRHHVVQQLPGRRVAGLGVSPAGDDVGPGRG